MPTFLDFSVLYDFSLIEKAVQAFFVALTQSVPNSAPFVAPADDDDPNRGQWTPPVGSVAFYTAFQNETFQKSRPRIYTALNNITTVKSYIVDAVGTFRAQAWKAKLTFGIVTEPSYTLHTSLRSVILTIIPQLGPQITMDGSGIGLGGVNGFLQYHEVGILEMDATTTHISPEDGCYNSVIPCTITFNVRATAWPGGQNYTVPGVPNEIIAQPGIGKLPFVDQATGVIEFVSLSNGQLQVTPS